MSGTAIAPGAKPFQAVEVPGAAPLSVMFGIPCYGGQLFNCVVHGLLECQREFAAAGVGFAYCTTTNESLVQRARNTIVAHFLASECTHLLFVDADIGFRAEHVFRLLAHRVPLIGGLYRKKRLDRVDWVATWLPGDTAQSNPATGAVKCAAVGTGFMLIERATILRMVEAFPATKYVQHPDDCGRGGFLDHLYALFDCWIDPVTRGYLSEDYAFCARWRAIGGDVWCDPTLLLEHHGTACFTGDPTQDIRPVP